jgi:hypothetical protein
MCQYSKRKSDLRPALNSEERSDRLTLSGIVKCYCSIPRYTTNPCLTWNGHVRNTMMGGIWKEMAVVHIRVGGNKKHCHPHPPTPNSRRPMNQLHCCESPKSSPLQRVRITLHIRPVRSARHLFHKHCIGSNGPIFTSVRRYFRSDAVKVIAMLTLPASGTSVSPQQAAAVLCRAAGWEAQSRVVSTSGSITRCSSGELLCCHTAQNFLKCRDNRPWSHSTLNYL